MVGVPADLQIPVGEVVRQWRTFRGLSVTELAARASETGEQARVSKGYVSELENGKIQNPRLERLAQLAEALGITVWHFQTREMPVGTGLQENGEKKLQEQAADLNTRADGARRRRGFGFNSSLSAVPDDEDEPAGRQTQGLVKPPSEDDREIVRALLDEFDDLRNRMDTLRSHIERLLQREEPLP